MSCFAEETFLYPCTCLTYTGGEMHVMLLTQHQYSISLLYENVNLKIMPILMNWKGLLGKTVLIELTEAPQRIWCFYPLCNNITKN